MTKINQPDHAEYFTEAAKDWDQNDLVRELANSAVKNISNVIALNDQYKVMEYGCGTGLIGMEIAQKVKSLQAWDSSSAMLEKLDIKLTERKKHNIRTRCIDLCAEPLPDVKFDLIFTSMALHHIEDTQAIIDHFQHLLEPNGELLLIDLDTEDGSFHGDNPGVFHHGFERKALTKLLEKNKFKDVLCDTSLVFNKPVDGGENKKFSTFIMTARKM